MNHHPTGNLTLFKTGNTRTTMVINNLNQIASAGSVRYTYDANGNLLDDGINTYTWDGTNRLLKISNKQTAHTSRFQYDGFSRRVSATETDSGATPVTTRFLWCGQRLCEQRDSSDKVIARYYPQGELRNGRPLFYARDQVGSVVALVDNTGKTIGRLGYDSYGNITSSTGTLPDYRYAGLFHHQASGLYLATYRAYDPKTGRWITADPIELAGGLNMYGYAESNPLRYADPFGLATYVVNRKLGGDKAFSRSNPLSHTFVSVTNQSGIVTATYSWGNTYSPTGFLQTKWTPPNQPEDMKSAQEAINKDLAEKISDGNLDPYIPLAYKELSKSGYETWHPWDSCKHKAGDLLDKAIDLSYP